jgi:hypothetical protein
MVEFMWIFTWRRSAQWSHSATSYLAKLLHFLSMLLLIVLLRLVRKELTQRAFYILAHRNWSHGWIQWVKELWPGHRNLKERLIHTPINFTG